MPNHYSEYMKDTQKFPLLREAPCFLQDDKEELINYINMNVVSANPSLLVIIDTSKVVPSKHLSDLLLNALKGNPFYSYDKGQATSVETIKATVLDCLKYDDKRTIIIKGGPGTGKSIVALNVLGQITKPVNGKATGNSAVYVTVNAAPRNLYSTKLVWQRL